MYGEVRKFMVEEFVAFGPLEQTPIGDGLSTEEILQARAQIVNDKKS